MPRRRTAPAPRPAARAAPAPAAPSAPRSYSSQARPSTPPPPAPAPAPGMAPPPAQQGSGGGSMLGGMMGMVGQGMAMGTGSAIAHRAVDSMMGPRGASTDAAQQPAQIQQQELPPTDGPCGQQTKSFSDCMSQNFGDMGACQQYFDAMQACKMNHQ